MTNIRKKLTQPSQIEFKINMFLEKLIPCDAEISIF